jgi:fatty-acyl-CoA synthase
MLYGDWIGRWGNSNPQKEALVDAIEGRRYTYGDFSRHICKMARFLQSEIGIQKGDRVAVLSQNRYEYLVLFFAASRIGAILVPLNVRLAPGEFAYFMEDAAPAAFFFDNTHKSVAEGLASSADTGIPRFVPFDNGCEIGVSLSEKWKDLPEDPPAAVDILPEDPQLIIYTSGTTGVPKGVIQTHGMLTWNAFNTNIGWDLRSDDRSILHSALYYTAGWNIFTLPLFHCRGTNILLGGFDAGRILELIESERISLFFGVPTMYQMLLDHARFDQTDMSSVRFMVSGGAPLPEKVFDAFSEKKGIHLWEGYGLTEAGPNNFMANGKRGSVGHPMFHVDLMAAGPDGRPVPPGQDGELLIRGNHVCAGYWNKPAETDDAFRDGWFCTGDLARVDEEGHFSIVGRKKDMFISGGINIYPAEVERTLEKHPAIAAVAVIGVPDEKWGEVGKAVVEVKSGKRLALAEMTDFLQDRLGKYKIPRYMTVVDELPRTAASGKVQKFLLKEKHGAADNE